MRKYIITPILKHSGEREVFFSGVRGVRPDRIISSYAWNGLSADSLERGLNPIYSEDEAPVAQAFAEAAALKWPMYQFLISEVKTVVVSGPNTAKISAKTMTDKGLLP